MLARIPAEKREEFKEMYHRMKKEESDHLKIDVKEEDIDTITPEQMMMGMTGSSTASGSVCPVMQNGGGSGSSETPLDL